MLPTDYLVTMTNSSLW